MPSKATTVDEYLSELPEDRREEINIVRNEILKHLPAGYEEGMQWGDIGYFVPFSTYPSGYDSKQKEPLQYVGLASQKTGMMIRFLSMYTNPELRAGFEAEYLATGKRLDLDANGGCLRFKKLENLPLDVITKFIAQLPVDKFVESYDQKRKALKKNSRT